MDLTAISSAILARDTAMSLFGISLSKSRYFS
jgi:hypothetical protein